MRHNVDNRRYCSGVETTCFCEQFASAVYVFAKNEESSKGYVPQLSQAIESKQSSHSDLVGDFIMNHPIYYLALHMYVLYTTERDDTIVNGCMSKTFCSGFTGVLEAETCSLFVESLPVKDRELLPKSNSLKQPTKHIYENRISRADEYLKLMKSLLQKGMDRHCLRTEKVSNTTATCSACIAKQLNAQIFNMGEQFENNNHESTAMEKPWLRYVYYIYTYTGINWNQLHSFCIQSCGVIKSEEDERNCLTPLNGHFDSSTRDLPIRTQSMSASSSVKPTFCIWIKMIMTETENQKPEICSTTSTNSKTIMELSEATYLLWTSDLTVLTCIGHSTQRLAITHEVPIAICEYEERVENPQETKRLQASGFDLNKKPRSELILAIPPRVRKQHNDDDDQTVRIQYDPSFHNVIKVIHLKNTAKDMILTCIICLCQCEEVLLVSVTQSYLWLTTKAEGTISGLSECKNKCSIDTSFPQHVNYLDDFQSLQPLSVDEVVSMYGEKGKDYSKLWRKSSDDVSIEMLDRIIEIE